MRLPYSTLTPIHIYDYAVSLLEPYLQWHDYGPATNSSISYELKSISIR
jgi:hypothetical protein